MDKSLPYLTRYLFKYIDDHIDKNVSIQGMDSLSCGIIDFLRNQEIDKKSTIQADIEKEFMASKALVSDKIHYLEENNYLYKESYPNDKRKYYLILTDKGRMIADEFYDQLVLFHEELLNSLNDKEKEKFVYLLNKVVTSLKKEEK